MNRLFEFVARARSLFRMDFSIDIEERLFSQIGPTLFLGARPREEHIPELIAARITHVVSALAEDQRPAMAFLQRDFEHLFVGIRDGMHQNIAPSFAPFFEFMEGTTVDPAAKVLVHCEVGVSRSPTLVIARLMQVEGLRFWEALQRVRSRRIQVLPNIGFASQLQQLENELLPDPGPADVSSLANYLRDICNAPVELDVLESALERHNYCAPTALKMIFGDDIPRVVQGVRA